MTVFLNENTLNSRTVPAVIFWQWINQSFNALVNYTNRNANSPITVNQLGISYVTATTSALVAAIGCKSYWQRTAGPFIQRYVPFAAVAAANCINIPLMRQQEIVNGIEVADEKGNIVGSSRLAAVKGISEVNRHFNDKEPNLSRNFIVNRLFFRELLWLLLE